MLELISVSLSVSIISTVAATLGMLIDGIVVSNFLGSSAMAAFGLAGPVFMIFTAISGVFSNGSISACAKYLGQDDTKKLNITFTAIIICSIVVSCVLMGICMLFSVPIAQLLGAENELIQPTADYIRGLGIGAVPIVLSTIVLSYARIDGSPDIGMKSIISMSVVNVSLDFANALVFKQGMFGMALATAIGYLAALLVSCIHFRRPNNTLRFVKTEQLFQSVKTVVITGAPNAINRLCNMARTTVLNRLLLIVGGSMAVAALSIQSTLNSILGGICLGVGSTMLLLSGIFYGEEDKRALTDAVKISLRTGFLLTTVISIAGIVFARPIVLIFARGDAELVAMTTKALTLFLLSLPFYTVSVVAMNFYQSTENLFMANFVCILDNFLFMVMFSGLLSVPFGVDGVWFSFVLCEFAMILALFLAVRVRTGSWPKRVEDFLMISDSITRSIDHELNLSLASDMSQVMKLSERIGEFCRANAVEEQRSNVLSMAIEEMAGNVVKYAFNDEKPHYMDIRIMLKGDDIIFRMRDDGIYFNPIEQYQKAVADSNYNQNGIRLIHEMAQSMDYRNTVRLNNLIVRI